MQDRNEMIEIAGNLNRRIRYTISDILNESTSHITFKDKYGETVTIHKNLILKRWFE